MALGEMGLGKLGLGEMGQNPRNIKYMRIFMGVPQGRASIVK